MEYLKLILRTLSTYEIKNYIYTHRYIYTHIYAYKYVCVALCLYRYLAVTGKTGFIIFITIFDSKGSTGTKVVSTKCLQHMTQVLVCT